ncbi:MAG: ATP-dependent sacrificial sulfur transferase LarE [Candidatus Korarchaeota archaeon]|nr:ATP-dependent sacrificial sulfur transferase LarE [Candidatus Korarchaeota archaeon]
MSKYRCPAIAFSGGRDSTFLLWALKRAGVDRVMAVTVDFPYIPRRVVAASEEVARLIGVDHIIIRDEKVMKENEILRNGPLRCYFCKLRMMSLILNVAEREGCDAVLDGTNASDVREDRPGLRALKELGVQSPLVEAGIKEGEVISLLRDLNLPYLAETCLLTRMPPGREVSLDLLKRIEDLEDFVLRAGVSLVRARVQGSEVRIEVPPGDMHKILEIRDEILEMALSTGFQAVTLDLMGYRGSKLVLI